MSSIDSSTDSSTDPSHARGPMDRTGSAFAEGESSGFGGFTWRNGLRLGFRVVLSALALYLASRKVDFAEAFGWWQGLVRSPSGWWLIPATAALLLSHGLSAERARQLWRCADLPLRYGYALRLYLAGMFYSLFLPGGVGGDGYKVFILKRHTKVAWKPLLQAGLLDRGGGVLAILTWCAAMALAVLVLPAALRWILIAGLAFGVPLYLLGMRWVFPRFWPARFSLFGLSLAKQGLQALSAVALVAAFVGTGSTQTALEAGWPASYATAFLLSSLALLLPISVGGVGARELMLGYLPAGFGINEELAVAMSLLFFLLNTAVSLTGILVRVVPVDFAARGENPEAQRPSEG
jgi:hypothetical protein